MPEQREESQKALLRGRLSPQAVRLGSRHLSPQAFLLVPDLGLVGADQPILGCMPSLTQPQQGQVRAIHHWLSPG